MNQRNGDREVSFAGYDLYVRMTQKDDDGKMTSYISHHRVWSGVKFIESNNAELAKKGGSCVMISEEEYRKERAK